MSTTATRSGGAQLARRQPVKPCGVVFAAPNRVEIVSCLPWLEAEMALLEPKLVVALGATAAKAFLGPSFSVISSP